MAVSFPPVVVVVLARAASLWNSFSGFLMVFGMIEVIRRRAIFVRLEKTDI